MTTIITVQFLINCVVNYLKKQNRKTNHSLLWLAGVAHLQREEESLPFFAPEVREDGGGCDGERQRHHNTRLTKRGRQENTTYENAHQRRPEKPTNSSCSFYISVFIPCGSSEGTASGPQKANTPPAPKQQVQNRLIRVSDINILNIQYLLILVFYKAD